MPLEKLHLGWSTRPSPQELDSASADFSEWASSKPDIATTGGGRALRRRDSFELATDLANEVKETQPASTDQREDTGYNLATSGKELSATSASLACSGLRGTELAALGFSALPQFKVSEPANAYSSYVIKRSPGKRLGVFANDNIPRGTRILSAKPLLSIKFTYTAEESCRVVLAAIEDLSDGQLMQLNSFYPTNERRAFWEQTIKSSNEKKELLRLCGRNTRRSKAKWLAKIMSIIDTNSFQLGTTGNQGIFLDASRINHSCVPNCHFAWNVHLGEQTVQAIRDIAQGEEITICYLPPFLDREQRQGALCERYEFECDCPACEDDSRYFSSRRMFELNQTMAYYQWDMYALGRAQDALAAAEELIELMEEEGLTIRALAEAYGKAAQYSADRGLFQKAAYYAQKELDVERICIGDDHPDSERVRERLTRYNEFAVEGHQL